MTAFLHVRIKATREQLLNAGAYSEQALQVMLSGRAFAVEKRIHVGGPNGSRVLVHLLVPDLKSNIWIFEDLTEVVQS